MKNYKVNVMNGGNRGDGWGPGKCHLEPFIHTNQYIIWTRLNDKRYNSFIRIKKVDILHKEIEIESKSIVGDSAILIISEYLVERYPDTLLIWMPSKLEFGLILNDLIQSGNQEIINNHKMSPELYCDLHEIWKRKS